MLLAPAQSLLLEREVNTLAFDSRDYGAVLAGLNVRSFNCAKCPMGQEYMFPP